MKLICIKCEFSSWCTNIHILHMDAQTWHLEWNSRNNKNVSCRWKKKKTLKLNFLGLDNIGPFRIAKRTWGFQINMSEWKDLCSSPLVRGLKSQLAVEQPSTGECWNAPKKDISCLKTEQWWEEHNHNKNQIPHTPGGWYKNWRIIISNKFPHYCEVSEPYIRLPRLGIGERDWDSQRIWPWRLQDLTIGLPQDWGKQRLQSWRAQIQSFTCQGLEERSSDPTGPWTKTTC